jgi:hypothetical protein
MQCEFHFGLVWCQVTGQGTSPTDRTRLATHHQISGSSDTPSDDDTDNQPLQRNRQVRLHAVPCLCVYCTLQFTNIVSLLQFHNSK